MVMDAGGWVIGPPPVGLTTSQRATVVRAVLARVADTAPPEIPDDWFVAVVDTFGEHTWRTPIVRPPYTRYVPDGHGTALKLLTNSLGTALGTNTSKAHDDAARRDLLERFRAFLRRHVQDGSLAVRHRVGYPDDSCSECAPLLPHASLDLGRTDLRRVDLSGAILLYTTLRRALLDQTDFRRADLYGVVFEGARLCSTDMTGAKIRGAEFGRTSIDDATLSTMSGLDRDLIVQLTGKPSSRAGSGGSGTGGQRPVMRSLPSPTSVTLSGAVGVWMGAGVSMAPALPSLFPFSGVVF